MYFDNDPESRSDLENQRILSLINESPEEAFSKDPEVRAAFEKGLRNLAEDIIKYNPGLAHILMAMSTDSEDSIHGQN